MKIPFVPDGQLHRLFCLSTRGWEIFRHLFIGPHETSDFIKFGEIIKKFLDGPSFLGNNKINTRKTSLQIAYDMSLNFPEYSDELAFLRSDGKESNFNKIIERFPFRTNSVPNTDNNSINSKKHKLNNDDTRNNNKK